MVYDMPIIWEKIGEEFSAGAGKVNICLHKKRERISLFSCFLMFLYNTLILRGLQSQYEHARVFSNML